MRTSTFFHNRFFLVFALFTLSLTSYSQKQKNVTKIGLTDACLKVIAVSQERTISKRVSIQASFKLMPQTRLPFAKYSERYYNDQSKNPFRNAKMSGYSLGFEIRIYRKKNENLSGCYWGPYFNHTIITANSGRFNVEFTEPQTQMAYTAELEQDFQLRMTGGGVQLGIQKRVGKLRLDWTILGIGISDLSLKGKINIMDATEYIDARNFNFNSEESKLAIENYFPVQKTADEKSIYLNGRGIVPMLKMGLALGVGY
jgi:hypothetical protein